MTVWATGGLKCLSYTNIRHVFLAFRGWWHQNPSVRNRFSLTRSLLSAVLPRTTRSLFLSSALGPGSLYFFVRRGMKISNANQDVLKCAEPCALRTDVTMAHAKWVASLSTFNCSCDEEDSLTNWLTPALKLVLNYYPVSVTCEWRNEANKEAQKSPNWLLLFITVTSRKPNTFPLFSRQPRDLLSLGSVRSCAVLAVQCNYCQWLTVNTGT